MESFIMNCLSQCKSFIILYFFFLFCLFSFVSCLPLNDKIEIRGIGVIVPEPSEFFDEFYDNSYALLIGASKYQNPGWCILESVPDEIDRIANVLKKHKFQIIKVLDPDRDQLVKAFDNFINEYGFDDNNRLLFFFSGHGHSPENSTKGYIVPVDAPHYNKDEKNFKRKAI